VKDGRATLSVKGDIGKYKESCKVKADKDVVFRTHPSKLVEALAISLKVFIGECTLCAKGEIENLPFWHVVFLNVLDEGAKD
jgi:hypothetical protein